VAVTSEVLPTGAVRLAGGVWSLDGRQHVGGVHVEEFPVIEEEEGEAHLAPKKAVVTYAAICALELAPNELAAAERCGKQLAEELMSKGAGKILREAKAQNDAK
jgi:hypothetical protein